MKKLFNTAVLSLTAMTFFTSCLKQDQQTGKSQSQQKSSSVLQSGSSETGYAPAAAAQPEVQMTPAPSIIEIAAQAEQKVKDDKVKAVVKPVVAPVAPAAPVAVEPEKKAEVVAAPVAVPVQMVEAPADISNERSIVGIWVTPKGGDTQPNAKNWFPIGYGVGKGDITLITPINRYQKSHDMSASTVVANTIAELQKMVDYSFGSANKNYEIRVGTFACDNPEGLDFMVDPASPHYKPALAMIDSLYAFSHYDGGRMIGIRHAWSVPPSVGAFRSDGNEFIANGSSVHIQLRDNAPYPVGNVPAKYVDAYLSTAAVELDGTSHRPDLGMDKVYIISNPAPSIDGNLWNPSALWNGLHGQGTQMQGATYEALKAVLKLQYPKDANLETYKTKIKEQLGSYFSQMEAVARASKDPERLSACEGMGLKVSATEPIYSWEPVPMNSSCHALFGEFSMGEFGESFYGLINPSEVPASPVFAGKLKKLATRLYMAGRHEAGHQDMEIRGVAPRVNCFGKENSKMSKDSSPQALVIGKAIQ